MPDHRLVMMAPALAMLATAAAVDLRRRRIPNWLTLSLAATGLMQSLLPQHTVTPGQAVMGLLTGFALNIGLFALHIRGGGDVKLFAGLGAWMGPMAIFEIFVVSTIIAAVVALMQCAAGGKLAALLKNTAVLAVSVANPRELGVAHLTREDGSFVSVGRPVPYAVPVIFATLLVLIFG